MERTKHPGEALPQPPDLTAPAVLIAIFVALAVVAAVLGLGAALYLRHRNLAWTWSLPAPLAPAAILCALIAGILPLSRGSGYALALAAGFAAALLGASAYLRNEDRRAGGDRETAAARRRGVLDAARRRFAERGDPRCAD